MELPTHLNSTVQLLKRAFLVDIARDQYFALLQVLEPHMSQRNLATVVAAVTGQPYVKVYRDVLGAGHRSPTEACIADVQERLDAAGFNEWVQGEL